jgi:hypothetical protein
LLAAGGKSDEGLGNSWQGGQPAYWWLSEKAEWWLEHKKKGGPVTLEEWAEALWQDERVQAAWPVAAEAEHRLELWKQKKDAKTKAKAPTLDASQAAFARYFKTLVKLNVPREGFRLTAEGESKVAKPF